MSRAQQLLRAITLTSAISAGLAAGNGCVSSGTSAGANASSVAAPEKQESAAQLAWDRLGTKSTIGDWIGRFGPSELRALDGKFKHDVAIADQQCDLAFQSDLPVQAIDDMTHDVAAYFGNQLPTLTDIANAKTKVVLAFPPPDRWSENARTADAMKKLRVQLFHNGNVAAHFVFVTSTEDNAKRLSDEIAGKDLSAFRDPLQEGEDKTKPIVYDPNDIYLIQGSLDHSVNKPNHEITITMTFEFESLTSRTGTLEKQVGKTYMWNPETLAWELQS